MSDLRDAVSKCLASAKRLLDETAVSGISLPVVVDDKDGKYEAVAESYAELTSKFLLCAWANFAGGKPGGHARCFSASRVCNREASREAVSTTDYG